MRIPPRTGSQRLGMAGKYTRAGSPARAALPIEQAQEIVDLLGKPTVFGGCRLFLGDGGGADRLVAPARGGKRPCEVEMRFGVDRAELQRVLQQANRFVDFAA